MIASQYEAEKLLRWAFQTCNEIQSIKTYGVRFPETASLAIEIGEYFQSLRNQSKCTCQSFENGLVADDCELHG